MVINAYGMGERNQCIYVHQWKKYYLINDLLKSTGCQSQFIDGLTHFLFWEILWTHPIYKWRWWRFNDVYTIHNTHSNTVKRATPMTYTISISHIPLETIVKLYLFISFFLIKIYDVRFCTHEMSTNEPKSKKNRFHKICYLIQVFAELAFHISSAWHKGAKITAVHDWRRRDALVSNA